MAKTREIKRRIKAVGNIKRITKTMQMIATARFQAAQKRATSSQPYTQKIAELVGELALVAQSAPGGEGGFSHPLLLAPQPPVNREILLVLTSNRGLCGGYNGNVLRTALHYIREHQGHGLSVEVVGKKGSAFLKFNNIEVSQFHAQFTDRPAYDAVEKLADRYMNEFIAGKYDAVKVVYMSFQSAARQVPRVLQILPLADPSAGEKKETKPQATVDYDFTPDPKTLLDELLPITVETGLFQAFNEAVVSEQIARMVAMKSATDSASKMGKSLSRRFNRARQAAITTELSEIIAGAAGLE